MVAPHRRPHADADDSADDPPTAAHSLLRPISPPRKRRREARQITSPWQLTRIRDLPEESNADAVTLHDLLRDPLIAECWEFNYLHDIPFLMDAFDMDVRGLVRVHVVHGFWKREDANRLMLEQEASAFPNVELHTAPMPEMFGTHHSKMMVLFRHDETAQIIIHTANMIPKDWTNMTNAVWKSPLLPKLESRGVGVASTSGSQEARASLGSGYKFKSDLLSYIKAYDRRGVTCKTLGDQLRAYDFSNVRAALVASVPGRHDVHDLSPTAWGWLALGKHLKSVRCEDGSSEIVVQVSSIATLGPKDDWLQKTLFDSMARSDGTSRGRPTFKCVFPSEDEIRKSLDGYAAGGSIHMRVRSQQQVKQLEYLRPMLCRWSSLTSSSGDACSGPTPAGERGAYAADDSEQERRGPGISGVGCRERAAPHIKTYIRYNSCGTIDWAMLTSANLSKQAWGDAVSAWGTVRIASWEIGVLLWPELFDGGASMVPSFTSDMPPEAANSSSRETGSVVGLRIPYSMPLRRYERTEMPWVATVPHGEADSLGHTWPG